jgi:uncharacterized protein
VEIAILSDTHMPRGSRRLPPRCIELLRAADLIVHGGDFVAASVLEELRGYGELAAVHGNVDDAEVRAALPASTVIDAGGAKLAVIHDAGPARGRMTRLRSRFPDADAVVFGHSHMPLHEQAPDGFQIFNPGSPTERRRAPHRTIGIARTGPRGLTFELVTVG